MKPKHILLLVTNLILIVGFGARFVLALNYEFIIYVGVIIFFLCVIGISLNKVEYSLDCLWGLTIWAAMHLAGGGINVGEGRLYDVMLIKLSDAYPIFRYDQLVHIFGFAASTLLMYCLLKRYLKPNVNGFVALSIVIVMAGLGVGAFNEIVEFLVSTLIPESGVGGYLNTFLDLVADLIGAVIAIIYIKIFYFGQKKITGGENLTTL